MPTAVLEPISFDRQLIKKYNITAPRYTSYPTAIQFNQHFTAIDYQQAIAAKPISELSLYFHLPFCNTICYYCACNKVVTKDTSKAVDYLNHLYQEIELQAKLFNRYQNNYQVKQLHWGGGTPTFLNHQQMQTLMQAIKNNFNCATQQADYSIEIDPRTVTMDGIALLSQLGFNRLSMGVQDFNPKVQQAVNRIQSLEQTWQVLQQARASGFRSISIDLIYGLPLQTAISFAETLEQVIQANPDRISLFNYAHLPHLFKPQRRINAEQLPSADEKLTILQNSIEQLLAADYCFIGMDHFAKKQDELTLAQQQGALHRNFQGYATHADCDLLAMGNSAIGKIANSYSQNQHQLVTYYQMLANKQLPLQKGLLLTNDDLLRREIIQRLMCDFYLEFALIEAKYQINFNHYFKQQWLDLQQLEQDQLIVLTKQTIKVTAKGRLLIRNIALVFDAYSKPVNQPIYSKAI